MKRLILIQGKLRMLRNIFKLNEIMKDVKQLILDAIEDLCSNFVFYDRKEDEDLSVDKLNDAVDNKIITVDEMVEHFKDCLLNTFVE